MSRKMITKASTRDSVRKLNDDGYDYQENASILAAGPFRSEYPLETSGREVGRTKRVDIRIGEQEERK